MARARKVEGLEIGWSEKGSFPIRISENLFDVENLTVAETLREATGSDRPRVMLVADANVVQRTDGLGTRIGKYVRTHGIERHDYLFRLARKLLRYLHYTDIAARRHAEPLLCRHCLRRKLL